MFRKRKNGKVEVTGDAQRHPGAGDVSLEALQAGLAGFQHDIETFHAQVAAAGRTGAEFAEICRRHRNATKALERLTDRDPANTPSLLAAYTALEGRYTELSVLAHAVTASMTLNNDAARGAAVAAACQNLEEAGRRTLDGQYTGWQLEALPYEPPAAVNNLPDSAPPHDPWDLTGAGADPSKTSAHFIAEESNGAWQSPTPSWDASPVEELPAHHADGRHDQPHGLAPGSWDVVEAISSEAQEPVDSPAADTASPGVAAEESWEALRWQTPDAGAADDEPEVGSSGWDGDVWSADAGRDAALVPADVAPWGSAESAATDAGRLEEDGDASDATWPPHTAEQEHLAAGSDGLHVYQETGYATEGAAWGESAWDQTPVTQWDEPQTFQDRDAHTEGSAWGAEAWDHSSFEPSPAALFDTDGSSAAAAYGTSPWPPPSTPPVSVTPAPVAVDVFTAFDTTAAEAPPADLFDIWGSPAPSPLDDTLEIVVEPADAGDQPWFALQEPVDDHAQPQASQPASSEVAKPRRGFRLLASQQEDRDREARKLRKLQRALGTTDEEEAPATPAPAPVADAQTLGLPEGLPPRF